MNTMRSSLPFTFVGRSLLAVLALVLICTNIASASPQVPAKNQSVVWEIRDAVVVSRGQQTDSDKGAMITGYTVEASAVAQGDAPITKGKYQATLTAFSPAQETAGQIAGTWPLQGTWTLTDVTASPEAAKARCSPSVLQGNFTAETDFNPALERGYLEAKVQTLTRGRGYGKKGGGSLPGNEKFEGEWFLKF